MNYARIFQIFVFLYAGASYGIPINPGSPTSEIEGDEFVFAPQIKQSVRGNASGWYYWIAPASGLVKLELDGSLLNAQVVTGDTLEEAETIAAASNQFSLKRTSKFAVTGGKAYHVRVQNRLGTEPFRLQLKYLLRFPLSSVFLDPSVVGEDLNPSQTISRARFVVLVNSNAASLSMAENSLLSSVGIQVEGTDYTGGFWLSWKCLKTGVATISAQPFPADRQPPPLILVGEGESYDDLKPLRGGKRYCIVRCVENQTYRIFITTGKTADLKVSLKAN